MKLEQEIELKHFGVLGMKWGHRKGSQESSEGRKTISTTTGFRGYINRKTYQNAVKDIASLKKAGKNQDAKELQDEIDDLFSNAEKKEFSKKGEALSSVILNNKVFKALVYNKDTGGFIRKDLVKRDVNAVKTFLGGAREQINRRTYQNAVKDVASLKKAGKDKEAKELQDEIDDLFSDKEKKKYS